MKKRWILILGILGGLLGAGILYLITRPPQGKPVSLSLPPTPAPLVIQINGAVNQPGAYELPPGSRVRDAIQAAGGLLPEADDQSLNLAAKLTDGMRLNVLRQGEAPPTQSAAGGQRININTATQAELETLPGIGPARAQDILAYREANGPFTSIEEIMDVPGIGPSTFEDIKDQISVESAP